MLVNLSNDQQKSYIKKEVTLPSMSAAPMPIVDIPEIYSPLLFREAETYFVEEEGYRMLQQHINCGQFSIWTYHIESHKDIILCPFSPHPIWALHFMNETSKNVEGYPDVICSLEDNECNILNLEPDSYYKIPMKGGQQIFILNINVLPSILTQLSIHNLILRQLSSKKAINQCSLIKQSYFVNSACDLLIRSILTCQFTGDIATSFLQRCCVDLFINLSCQDIQQSNTFTISTLINRDLFSHLFDYLVDHPQMTYTVEQLSEMFVIREDLLRSGFRKYFSIPIEAFMKMNKMLLLFNLIAHPETKLSTISSITGFNSVTEMSQAFYEYYGLDIPVLRKSI